MLKFDRGSLGQVFLSALYSGLMITVGAAVFLSVENKLAAALLFTIGLYAIVLNDLDLFTGKVGYLLTVKEKVAYTMTLLVIWLGNFAGTFLGARALKLTRLHFLQVKAGDLSQVKLADNPISILVLSIFCGLLMFIAVDGYRQKGNPLILFMGVAVFILAGFEHCIANMFYFSLAGSWSVKALAYILIMTLGNGLGGVLIPLLKTSTGRLTCFSL